MIWDMSESKPFPARKPRKPRKLTETYFYNAALHYLQRFSAPAEQLRRVLQRKVMRAQMRGEETPPEAPQWIDKAVEKCVKLGFVNDQIFTEQKTLALRRQGKARAFIASTLQQKGVDKAMIQDVLGHDAEDELNAAIRAVKRKRLGRDETPEGKQKDLAKLARGGFSLDVARRAMAAVKVDQQDDS